jgi:hypothetical protein
MVGRPKRTFRGRKVSSSRKKALTEKKKCLFKEVQPLNAI